MELKDKAEKIYSNNYNCAETVLRTVDEDLCLGLPECAFHAIGGFGGGCGCGELCGAVAGAIESISLKYIDDRAHKAPKCSDECRRFIEEYKKRFGSVLCSELRPKNFTAKSRCFKTISDVCELLEEFL